MDIALQILMQKLTKLVAPSSPAYGNLPFIKEQSLSEILGKLQVGDIIFTKTNNSIYQLVRKHLSIDYDHVAVVINKDQVLHVSPNIISKLQTKHLVQKNRQPLIYRPQIQKKQQFINLLTSFLGEKYNTEAIPTMLINEMKNKASFLESQNYEFSIQALKYSKICTEVILYTLCGANPNIYKRTEEIMKKSNRYKTIGYVMPTQLIQILEKNAELIYKGPPTAEKTVLDLSQDTLDYINAKLQPFVSLSAFKYGKNYLKSKKIPMNLTQLITSSVLKIDFRYYLFTSLILSIAQYFIGKQKAKIFMFTILALLLYNYLLPQQDKSIHQILPKL